MCYAIYSSFFGICGNLFKKIKNKKLYPTDQAGQRAVLKVK